MSSERRSRNQSFDIVLLVVVVIAPFFQRRTKKIDYDYDDDDEDEKAWQAYWSLSLLRSQKRSSGATQLHQYQ